MIGYQARGAGRRAFCEPDRARGIRGAAAGAEQPGRPDARRRRRLHVERVAQRELDLAFGAGQRQARGLLRRPEQGRR
jgi:hypothetical protein